MAGAVALASTGYIACDRREKGLGGPRRLGPGLQGSPQREPSIATETAREQSTRAQGRVILFGAGGWIAAQCGRRGQACSPATVP